MRSNKHEVKWPTIQAKSISHKFNVNPHAHFWVNKEGNISQYMDKVYKLAKNGYEIQD